MDLLSQGKEKIMLKHCRWTGFLLLCLALLVCASAQAEGLRGYDKNDGWQYVRMGSYPCEADGTEDSVLWQVLRVQDGKALLLTTYVIDTQQVIFVSDQNAIKNHSYRRISDYKESDLIVWMNEVMYPAMMGSDPLRAAVTEEEYGYLYILTRDDYLDPSLGFSKQEFGEVKIRRAVGTPYAVKMRGLYVNENGMSPYWAAYVKSPSNYMLQLVGYDGHLSYGAYSRVNVGIRAAITLDTSLFEIAGGSGTEEDAFILRLNALGEAAAASIAPPVPAAEEAPAEAAEAAVPEAVPSAPEETPVPEETSVSEAALVPEETPVPEDVRPTIPPWFIEAPDLINVIPDIPEPTPLPTAEPTPLPTAEPTPLPAAEADASGITLSFIGDCSIGDATQSVSGEKSLTSFIRREGYAWPFSTVREFLEADDYTFANLEVTLTVHAGLKSDKMYNLIAPPEFTEVLKLSGVDVFNTVNNHAIDFTLTGYHDTLDALDAAGINNFGTLYPKRENGSDRLGTAEVKGVKIGMVGYSYPQDADIPGILQRVTKLKEEEGCDLVVVSLHWGREEHLTSEAWQYTYARQLIDGGADIIWGHHPHVLQPVMFYKGKPVMFSTGNFIFGTISDLDKSTGIFQLHYSLDEEGNPVLDTFSVIPLETTRRDDYRPRVLTDEAEIRTCLNKLIYKKAVNGYTQLPASFADTGTVRVLEDGTLE